MTPVVTRNAYAAEKARAEAILALLRFRVHNLLDYTSDVRESKQRRGDVRTSFHRLEASIQILTRAKIR